MVLVTCAADNVGSELVRTLADADCRYGRSPGLRDRIIFRRGEAAADDLNDTASVRPVSGRHSCRSE